MMTNLHSSAFVARTTQLLSSVARLRLLLVMLLTLTVSANAWGADVTFSTSAYNGKGGVSGTGGNATATIDGVTITSTKAYYTSAYIREYSGGTITVSSSSNITKIVFTSTASGTNSNGPGKISLNSGGGSYSYSGTAGTWTGSSTSIKFDCDAQFRWTKIVVTIASSHTVTWTINPAAGGTLSATSGNSTTVSPNAAYTYGAPAYTVTSGAATVSQSGNTFTATPTANSTIQINMVEKPKYTVTLNAGPGTCAASVTEASAGKGVTLPTPTLDCGDWEFAGWAEASVGTETTTKPTLIAAGTYKPASNITLYAVYQRTEGGGGTSYQFQKVTALSQIKAGGTFIITNGSYYLPNAQASSSGPVKANMVAVTNGVVTGAVTDAMKWTFSAADANGKITIKSAANSNYYLYTTNSNGGLRVNNTSDTWTFEEYTVSNILGFAMKSTSNSRYCAVYTDGSDWRSYTTKNAANYKTNSGRLDLYKYTEISSNTTYYHSTPDCVTETAVYLIPKNSDFWMAYLRRIFGSGVTLP